MLRLYNTMTRSVDIFVSKTEGEVGLYTCGPTVYAYAHIGNLRTYIFEDILRRVLVEEGYRVKHVMNVTDVGHLVSDADTGEDKMAVGASREGLTAFELADKYWEAFRHDMARLHILEPDIWCRATEYIQEQIDLGLEMEKRGFTYRIEDGIYFDTKKLGDYGRLARLDIEGLEAGARIEMVAGKRNPTDFAVWKFSPKDEKRQMEWESPWGTGFPGWHLECSAMAMKHLGEQFDIHCGGIDHVAVHHTNEIAQVECITQKNWVRWWMHAEFLVLPKQDDGAGAGTAKAGGKMAKSGDNFLTVQSLVDRKIDPVAYRYFALGAHYRAPLTFTWESVEGAANAMGRLRNRVIALGHPAGGSVSEKHWAPFRQAYQDDLNMPRALAALWGLLRDDGLSPEDQYATLLRMDRILGLGVESMKEEKVDVDQEILDLVDARNAARRNKDFAEADRLRDEITSRGFLLEDTAEGTKVLPAG
ncbi:MAG: cysteine--tRNA ligase [Gemmatimonadetes bacterium]|nr:cysteine--tRNA ligase [Gemmatimonadota bacterium]